MPIDQALAVTRTIEDLLGEIDADIIRDINLNMPQKTPISIPFSTFQYGVPEWAGYPRMRVWAAIRLFQERQALEYIVPARVLQNVGHH